MKGWSKMFGYFGRGVLRVYRGDVYITCSFYSHLVLLGWYRNSEV